MHMDVLMLDKMFFYRLGLRVLLMSGKIKIYEGKAASCPHV